MSAYDDPALVGFFAENRNRPADLYPSERRFLGWLARTAASVLDVGCAAGGFADIWHSYNPEVDYLGVDLSEALIEAARARHPDSRFLVGDCAGGLPLPDRAADVVQALGWLHWEPRYAQAIRELWRLTGRRLFFDVRLAPGEGPDIVGRQAIGADGSTPYVVVAWERLAATIRALDPALVLAYGYSGPPADTVSGVPDSVCFATFVLERGEVTPGAACLDVPLPWPESFADLARHEPGELERFAPS